MNIKEIECLKEKERVFEVIDSCLLGYGEGLRIELGCGKTKKSGFIGIDNFKHENVDICMDLDNFLQLPFENDSVCSVRAVHSLEHIGESVRLWNEIYRVCKKDALVYAVVPHPMAPYYYQDFTHKSFYTEKTFSKYLDGEYVKIYSDYFIECKFSSELVFCYGADFSKICVHALLRAVK